ncbi:deoxyuridine 5'-triphosphate nucleotidohydrolase [Microthyrium microscopicum]|uniref:Deoxyuridine 5'-triphosphate nucleotidohydrolase n=1 Tax=Microthyrium microscopicum TaxID=703497 RepID=A0A6A6U3T9_9PEZI|nr:deoxyuridine 5'-triphosphate nucleotidohydrolase [Microthyrium microscopicum]
MILPGKTALAKNILSHGIVNRATQVQPCGIDLTLKRVLTFTSSGSVDFDNSQRKLADTTIIPFQPSPALTTTTTTAATASDASVTDTSIPETREPGFIDLPAGAYLVEFNEKLGMPLDAMGELYVRSSLFRSGALLSGGVMDSGYHGALGALLQVINPYGLRLWRDARLGQMVVHEMAEKTDGYQGMYQGKVEM